MATAKVDDLAEKVRRLRSENSRLRDKIARVVALLDEVDNHHDALPGARQCVATELVRAALHSGAPRHPVRLAK